MKDITFIKGDATYPKQCSNEICYIAHICNDIGKWGKGFVMALSKRWSAPEQMYRSLSSYSLGTNQYVTVGSGIIIVNMIGQHHIFRDRSSGLPPIRYEAVSSCLKHLAKNMSSTRPCSVHMPKIGCGLAGGEWNIIKKIIEEELCDKEVDVFVYEL